MDPVRDCSARDVGNETDFGRQPDHEKFALSRRIEKSHRQRQKSPYTLSYWSQIKLCMWREVTRLKNDPSVPLVMLVINFFEALIIASIFFNLRETTDSFFMRGAVLFMMVSALPLRDRLTQTPTSIAVLFTVS